MKRTFVVTVEVTENDLKRIEDYTGSRGLTVEEAIAEVGDIESHIPYEAHHLMTITVEETTNQ